MLEYNLYKRFKAINSEDFYYYNDNGKIVPDIYDLMESEETSYKFILDYSKSGCKEKLADCFKTSDDYEKKGKHRHSISLYYLGCYLLKIFAPYYDGLINKYIKLYTENKEIQLNKNMYNPLYIWFLTCLFHDTASCIEEQNKEKIDSFDSFVNKFDFNLLNHKFSKKNKAKSLYYTQKTIHNYFDYRQFNNKLDHGINAGFELFNMYCLNYNEENNNPNKKLKKNNEKTVDNIFYIDKDIYSLQFSPDLIDHFAIVAQTIMCHNIWNINIEKDEHKLKEKIPIYRKYKLYDLLINDSYNSIYYAKGKKINIEKSPLLFFVDLLDTIEPIKYLINYYSDDKHHKDNISKYEFKDILENIDISYDELKKVLHINSKMFMIKEVYINWINNIKKLEHWMDLKIGKNDNGTDFEIKFNVKIEN